ncbi:MAG: class I SAM-dependent methyltransferase [Bacteroidetes bacterium]|nr:class I SAM-dependent methyltransferase [Bacteroidota bacterium]MBU1422049.1 class I SAM-dependent methyltransferase [Bacteroidota bacterium]MBU2636399.1 class I SAM-dependent methyltransferase [Bacteroidota bacterium]
MKNNLELISLLNDKIEISQYAIQHKLRFEKIINSILSFEVNNSNKNFIKILDFGSLDGTLAIALKSFGFEVICTDIDEVLNEFSSNYINNNIIYKPLLSEQEIIPLPDNYFHYVVFSEVLEHLYNSPLAYLNEIHRVLKNNGKLILTTPNVMRLENKIKFFLNLNIYQDLERYCYNPRFHLHFKEYTRKEVKILLEKHLNFKNVNIKLFDYVGGRTIKARFVQRILFLFNIIFPFLKNCMLVTANKN